MESNGWVMWNMGTFNDPCLYLLVMHFCTKLLYLQTGCLSLPSLQDLLPSSWLDLRSSRNRAQESRCIEREGKSRRLRTGCVCSCWSWTYLGDEFHSHSTSMRICLKLVPKKDCFYQHVAVAQNQHLQMVSQTRGWVVPTPIWRVSWGSRSFQSHVAQGSGHVRPRSVTCEAWDSGTVEIWCGFVWKCWVYSQWNSHLIGIMIINHWV